MPGNLTSSTGNLNFDFEFSLRPLLEFSASALGSNYTQEIYADVPNLELSVSQVSGVTDTCDPAPSGAPSSQIYNNLTHVVPSVGFDLVWNNDGQLETLDSATLPGLPTACLEYFPKTSKLSTPNKNDASGNIHGMTFMALMVVGSLVVLLLWVRKVLRAARYADDDNVISFGCWIEVVQDFSLDWLLRSWVSPTFWNSLIASIISYSLLSLTQIIRSIS